MNLICEHCHYFEPRHDNPKFGWCRRYPPQVVVDVDAGFGSIESLIPYVSKDDWCGEFSRPPLAKRSE